mgnify:CR=1 FL=1
MSAKALDFQFEIRTTVKGIAAMVTDDARFIHWQNVDAENGVQVIEFS